MSPKHLKNLMMQCKDMLQRLDPRRGQYYLQFVEGKLVRDMISVMNLLEQCLLLEYLILLFMSQKSHPRNNT